MVDTGFGKNLMHEPNKSRRYTPDFKTRAVNLLLNGNHTINGVARDLGISYSALLKWKESHMSQQRSQQSKAKPKPQELERQLRLLQRENQSLRNQRDILKKALGIFSEDPSQKGMPE